MKNIVLGLCLALLGAQGIRAQGWDWEARYNGPVNLNDVPYAVSVDLFGNVYVTGNSSGSGTQTDYATVKFPSSGDTILWVNRYNSPDSSWDDAADLTTDALGNVYVTGRSERSVSGYDYTTIKYLSGGGQAWVTSYNGPGNNSDEAEALFIDPSGNVYVTGRSIGSGTDWDYGTVKYNNAGGELWVSRYNGPDSTIDEAAALSVDNNGNVYVTGRSLDFVTSFDYATVKYDNMGNQQWAARYDNVPTSGADEASAIAVDDLGNVYVTGKSFESGAGDDYFTIKYNSSGVQQWAVRYNGPGNGPDAPTALVIDPSGNVYVTGSSWSGTSIDYATIKYNNLGMQVWLNLYDGTGNGTDEARALAVDDQGNVYVTGVSDNGSNDDFATVKYDSTGVEVWASVYNGAVNMDDEANSIFLDNLGNLYVTGMSFGSGSLRDYATLKYCREDDVGVLSLPTPADTIFTGTSYSPEAWIQNLGGCEVDTIEVTVSIGTYMDTVLVTSLPPGDSILVAFALWNVLPGDSATYLFTVCVNLVGDGDPSNDCAQKTIFAHENQGPALLSAVASDNLIPVIGIDDDDQVLISFDEPTNKPVIDASNINMVLSLSGGHTWTDGAGFIRSSAWNGAGDGLLITLSTNSGLPTVAVGDTLTPDGVTITDLFGNPALTPVIITGSFDPQPGVEENLEFRTQNFEFRLFQNFPNPFHNSTFIRYTIPATEPESRVTSHVSLAIYDLTGRLVETLVEKKQEPGVYEVVWEGRDLSNGIYLYRLQSGDLIATKKLILLR